MIINIENGINNCPYCAGKKILPGYNGILTLYLALSDEAYEIGNYMIGINMNELLPTSTKKGYFQCPDCKKAYSMRICDRVEKLERGHRACPRCNLISKKKKFVF